MRPYTFFKHHASSVLPVFDLSEFESEMEARLHAYRLLREGPQYRAIEVWDGVGEPFTVERSRLPDRSAGEHGGHRENSCRTGL